MIFVYLFFVSKRYMKYLYPYECEKRGLSNPNELQAAIDSNRREGRRQGFSGSIFTYSPSGTHTMLSSPKLQVPTLGLTSTTNGNPIAPVPKIKKGNSLHPLLRKMCWTFQGVFLVASTPTIPSGCAGSKDCGRRSSKTGGYQVMELLLYLHLSTAGVIKWCWVAVNLVCWSLN